MRRQSLAFLLVCACAPAEREPPPNRPPNPFDVSVRPARPTTVDTLTATYSRTGHPQDHEVSYALRWEVDDAGVDASSLGDEVPATLTRKGQTWRAIVLATDSEGESLERATATVIENSPPIVTVTIPAVSASDDIVAEVTVNDPDDDPIDLTYSWTRNGQLTSFTTNTVPGSEVTRGDTWSITVTATDDDGEGSSAVAAINIRNLPPVVTSVSISPTTARSIDPLTAEVIAEDPDGDPITTSVRWFDDGALITIFPSNTLDADLMVRGMLIQAEATASDGRTTSAPVLSNTVEVLNSPPQIRGITSATEDAQRGLPFTAILDGEDPDDDPLTLTWTFRVDGAVVQQGSDATLPAGTLVRGQTFQVEVEASDGFESTSFGPVSFEVVNSPPTVSEALLTPSTPTPGEPVSCVGTGAADPDDDPVTLTYAWRCDGVPCAAGPTLDGPKVRPNTQLTCEVTPFDGTSEGAPAMVDATVDDADNELLKVTLVPHVPRAGTPMFAALTWRFTPEPGQDAPDVTVGWYVNGDLVLEAPSLTDRDLGAPGTPRRWEQGDSIQAIAQIDGSDADPVASEIVVVGDARPNAPRIEIGPVNPSPTDTLQCLFAVQATDPDGTLINDRVVRWYVNGQLVSPGIGNTTTFDIPDDGLLPAAWTPADHVTCEGWGISNGLDGFAGYRSRLGTERLPTQTVEGWFHTCRLRPDGTAACRGLNGAKVAVEDGSFIWSALGQASPPPSSTFTKLSAAGTVTCGLRTNGTVACWGAWIADSECACPTRNSYVDAHNAFPQDVTYTDVVTLSGTACAIREDDASLDCRGPWADMASTATPPPGPYASLSFLAPNQIRAQRVNGTTYNHGGISTTGVPANIIQPLATPGFSADAWGLTDYRRPGTPIVDNRIQGDHPIYADLTRACRVRLDGSMICAGGATADQLWDVYDDAAGGGLCGITGGEPRCAIPGQVGGFAEAVDLDSGSYTHLRQLRRGLWGARTATGDVLLSRRASAGGSARWMIASGATHLAGGDRQACWLGTEASCFDEQFGDLTPLPVDADDDVAVWGGRICGLLGGTTDCTSATLEGELEDDEEDTDVPPDPGPALPADLVALRLAATPLDPGQSSFPPRLDYDGYLCGWLADGTVVCEQPFSLDLDEGTTIPGPPSDVPMVSLTSGFGHHCGLDAQGREWCWGLWVEQPL